ncbi:MAG: ATP-binding cassette domain-containing protein, partial [Bacteroidetes bacterium]|nr:ATP-binding cassette domain-containing protein [Bacteroidota bacterium]
MEDREVIISVKNFTAAYGANVIIDNISFDVYKGEIFVILGGSGCGKSTVLKHMIGLYQLASGQIIIEGEDITDLE